LRPLEALDRASHRCCPARCRGAMLGLVQCGDQYEKRRSRNPGNEPAREEQRNRKPKIDDRSMFDPGAVHDGRAIRLDDDLRKLSNPSASVTRDPKRTYHKVSSRTSPPKPCLCFVSSTLSLFQESVNQRGKIQARS